MKPFLVILTGPSCAGKSTLEGQLREVGFASLTSITTRAPRAGEVDGKHYHFVNETRFAELLEEGALVASVRFGDHLYGMTKSEINRHSSYGAPVVVVCEPNGRDQIIDYCEKHDWSCHAVYVGNTDKVIAERFLNRLHGELTTPGTPHWEMKNIVKRYADRMAIMMTTERTWAIEAYFQNGIEGIDRPYDRLLWSFDESNDKQVVAAIVEEFRKHKLTS